VANGLNWVTMIELTPLHAALLDLALEDWIPLFEALEAMRFEGFIGADESVATISDALVDLLRAERIRYGAANGRSTSHHL